jgi:hypothetical protein
MKKGSYFKQNGYMVSRALRTFGKLKLFQYCAITVSLVNNEDYMDYWFVSYED